MNSKSIAIGCLGFGTLVGAGLAQPAGVYSSGILHTPLGGVAEMSSVERRLTACCIGSSGQDGVEVQLHSASGGGAGVDLSPLTGASGREIKVRIRGWDGTVRGNLRCTSNDDGSISNTVDFSGLGATGCIERRFDEFGVIIAEIYTPGPIWAGPTVPNCTPPLVPTVWYTSWHQWVWGCGDGNNLYGDPYPYTQMSVSPILPPGIPVTLDVDSIQITGTDVGPMNVVDASVGTFGVSSWGVGGAAISEVCLGASEPCPPSERGLVASNIGSTGQDGVAIDFGPDAGSVSLRSRRCPDCPPGHVTLIRFYDDAGRVILSAGNSEDPATGASTISPDFSAIGADQYRLDLLDGDGNELSSSFQISGYAIAYLPLCPEGAYPKWVWIAGHWYFMGCQYYMDFVLPSGEVVTNVAEARITPTGATSAGSPRQCVVTDTGTITIDQVTVSPRCDGDLNGDNAVDLADLAGLLSHFGTPSGATAADGDLNGDGSVDLTDLAALLARFGSICG